jgi:hypothetical protein
MLKKQAEAKQRKERALFALPKRTQFLSFPFFLSNSVIVLSNQASGCNLEENKIATHFLAKRIL